MQTEWYRSFLAAVKWKSLTKAADRLSLTQPAISKHIRNLETAYGVELLRRGSTGVDLTDAGQLFLDKIAPVMDSLRSLDAEMRRFAEQPNISLGSLPSVASYVLPHRLRDYHAAGYPISVGVHHSSELLMEHLMDGTYDAVLIDAEYSKGKLWSRSLFTEGYLAILPKGSKLQGSKTLRAADLAGEDFVFSSHCDTRIRFTRLAEKNGFLPKVKLETDNNGYLLGVVAEGNYVTIMPALFQKQSEQLGLRAIPLIEDNLERTIILAARTADTGKKLYRLLNADTAPEPAQATV